MHSRVEPNRVSFAAVPGHADEMGRLDMGTMSMIGICVQLRQRSPTFHERQPEASQAVRTA